MINVSRIHLIGIGGTGISAIARVLFESGYQLTGSDQTLSPLAISLREAGVPVFIGHQAENIGDAELVVISSAIPESNVELQEAKARKIPVLKRSEFLGQMMLDKFVIAVAGTHGKTTTTAMLAWTLDQLGMDPSYIIGGVSQNLMTNAHAGKGTFFVIEADEYDRMFLGLSPDVAVITNVEHDHPDCFPQFGDFLDAFVEFTDCVKEEGTLLVNGDDEGASKMIAQAHLGTKKIYTFGFGQSDNDYSVENIELNRYGGYSASVIFNSSESSKQEIGNLNLQVPGRHNILNALVTLAVIHRLGLSVDKAAVALSEFIGTGRRFEVRGEAQGVEVIDDYAHHPTEIRAVLSAAKTRYAEKQIWVVWQPHTYSRTRMLAKDFSTAFTDADHLIVTEIYPSRETQPADGYSAINIVRMVEHPDVRLIPALSQVTSFLLANLGRDDVLLVLSAGDADQISTNVLIGLNEKERCHA